eukprot:EG_transcript_36374
MPNVASPPGAFIPPELIEFVEGLSEETFRDFPCAHDDAYKLTPSQVKHCTTLVQRSQKFNKLRFKLCPVVMTDAAFWKVYFTLLSNSSVSHMLHLDEYLDSRVMGWKQPEVHELEAEDESEEEEETEADRLVR